MRSIQFSKMFVFLVRLLLSLIIAIILLNVIKNRQNSINLSKSPTAIPASFEECDGLSSFEGKDDPSRYFFCEYFVTRGNFLYKECLAKGGKVIESACTSYSCAPAGCRLIYINPNYQLPKNYNECENVLVFHGGGRSINEHGGKEYCNIIIESQGVFNSVFNKDINDKLIKDCFAAMNMPFKENTDCVLKFYDE